MSNGGGASLDRVLLHLAPVRGRPGARAARWQGCLGLGYPSQCLDRLGRLGLALDRIAAEAGEPDRPAALSGAPRRPTSMRQATYRAHLARLALARARFDAAFLAGAARILERPRRRPRR